MQPPLCKGQYEWPTGGPQVAVLDKLHCMYYTVCEILDIAMGGIVL